MYLLILPLEATVTKDSDKVHVIHDVAFFVAFCSSVDVLSDEQLNNIQLVEAVLETVIPQLVSV